VKKLLVVMLMGGLFTLGCNHPASHSSRSGGGGNQPSGPGAGAGENTGAKGAVALTLPEDPVSVKQGQKATVDVTIERTDYKGDVTLTFDVSKKSGLVVTSPEMAEGKNEAKANVDASKAEPGEYTVEVTAKGGEGLEKPATGSFKVTVTKAAATPDKHPVKTPDKTPKTPDKNPKTPDKNPAKTPKTPDPKND
jgi:hypothetical protein